MPPSPLLRSLAAAEGAAALSPSQPPPPWEWAQVSGYRVLRMVGETRPDAWIADVSTRGDVRVYRSVEWCAAEPERGNAPTQAEGEALALRICRARGLFAAAAVAAGGES